MSDAGQDLSNNPFLALFGSIGEAKSLKSTFADTKADVSANISADKTQLGRDINEIIEDIFLITINRDYNRNTQPLVFLEDLLNCVDQQKPWIGAELLEQAVFERIMLTEPKSHLVNRNTSTRQRGYELAEVPACQTNPVRYLMECFQRLNQLQDAAQRYDKARSDLFSQCRRVILLNSSLCFQQPDLFITLSEKPSAIFLDTVSSALQSVDSHSWIEYFELLSVEIAASSSSAANADSATATTTSAVLDAFRPAMTSLHNQLKELTLSRTDLNRCVDVVTFFTRTRPFAEAFVEYITPRDWTRGRDYEDTLLGYLLRPSCVVKLDGSVAEFFDRPSRLTQFEVDNVDSVISQLLETTQEKCYHIIHSLLKYGGNIKERMLDWLGRCLHANAGRAKMWSHQMLPQMFNAAYSSDGFFMNLLMVLLRLSAPFTAGDPQLILRVQPTYCLATLGDRTVAKSRKVHMIELKDTCMVPRSEDVTIDCESSYTFATECFFMTHYCWNLSFRVLHERLVKLNQEVHRIQQIHQDIVAQGAMSAGGLQNDTADRLKEDMERVMTVYLCLKAALTQTGLLDRGFSFHVATATYLVAMAKGYQRSDRSHGDGGAVSDEAQSDLYVPPVLQCLPEIFAENVQDFLLFLHRFKDQIFEQQSNGLEPLLTYILVFMGSSHLMRNPHLRAGMAESLETLLPIRNNSQQSMQSLLVSSHFQRERLFETHPMVDELARALINVFVSIEMTGQGVQFEYKFKYRQPMYLALRYVWQIEHHRNMLKNLASSAESHLEDTQAPLFLRFINLLINDAIYLLDEALNYLTQLKQKQEARDAGEWQQLTPAQRQEVENGYRHMSMLARFHNIMGNETIQALEMITTEIKSIFLHNVMIDRIVSMLNYFLLQLVGPKKKYLKVKNFDEFQFRPRELVASICHIYINLSDETFYRAVSRDGRSYSHDLFEQAEAVLCKIHEPADVISQFSDIAGQIKLVAEVAFAEDIELDDVPEEYIDPIMGDLMRDPVILPSSRKIVDRTTIARHILSDQFDPFNRQPLTMDKVEPAVELKRQIDQWLADHKLSKR